MTLCGYGVPVSGRKVPVNIHTVCVGSLVIRHTIGIEERHEEQCSPDWRDPLTTYPFCKSDHHLPGDRFISMDATKNKDGRIPRSVLMGINRPAIR